jgi:Zn ribbon nucleic-acid-binding protein
MSQPTCVLCAHYHPRADPHPVDGPGRQSCEAGRRRLERELFSLKSAFRRLGEEISAEVGARDAVSRLLPAAPTPSPSTQPSVSGSKERQLPIDVNRVDLLLPATAGQVDDPYHDQAGHYSVATVLNAWVRIWYQRWFTAERYPRTDAISLIDWLLGVRLIRILDAEQSIADFAQAVQELRGLLRWALRDSKPKRAQMWGVPCPRCQLTSQLSMDPEDPDHYRECDNCGIMLSSAEYLQHLRDQVDKHRHAPR